MSDDPALIRALLRTTIPRALTRGLERHGYYMVNWRITNGARPIKLYQFRRSGHDVPPLSGGRTTPYEWSIAEAWQWLARCDLLLPHDQQELLL